MYKKVFACILVIAIIICSIGAINAFAEQGSVPDDYTLVNDDSGKATATLESDPLSIKTDNVIKIDTTGTTQLGKVALYKSISVEKNTDYVWTFDAYISNGNFHRFGVVVGNTVVNSNQNETLPITMTANPGNISVGNTGSDAGGEYVAMTKGTWTGDPNWKFINGTYSAWGEMTITFNSGDNTSVCLAYAPRAAGRTIYFTDWSIEKISVVPKGYELLNDSTGNATACLESDPLSIKTDNVIKIDTTGTTQLGKVALYKSISVEKNTDYVWTFDAYISKGYNHRFGVVVGNTVVNSNENETLPITMTANPGNISVGNTGSDAGGEYVAMTKGTWTGDPNWKFINGTNSAWGEMTISFNSGNNTSVCLAYAPRAYDRTIYFTDWKISTQTPIQNLVNGDFEETGYKDNEIPGYNVLMPTSGPVASVVDGAEGRTGNILKLDTTQYSGAPGKFGIYQTVQVIKNTDYVWSFYMNATNGANHHFGIVSGKTVSNSTTNSTLPILTCVSDQRSGVTIGNNTTNGFIVADTTNWTADTKWKEVGNFNKWAKFTVTFNTGDNDYVCLAYSSHAVGRVAYFDDWKLVQKNGIDFINGEFTNGLSGYKTEGGLNAQINLENDNYFAEITGTQQNYGSTFYQEISVCPNSEYVWNFRYKTITGGNVLFGVRNAQTTTSLIPSYMKTTEGLISGARFFEIRNTDYTNWHQGNSSNDYATVTVKFYTCDCSSVLLTINPVNDSRKIYTDNWSVSKSSTKYGDADASGVFDANDLTTLKKALMGSLSSDYDYSPIGLDANADYNVNILDLVNIKKSFSDSPLPNELHDNYRLVWSDEFNSSNLDSSKWKTEDLMTSKSDDLELRTDDSAIKMNDGSLLLKSGCIDSNHYYTDEAVTTKDIMAYKYGYLEIRAKVPYGAPSVPAFWMQGAKIDNEVTGEIDIFEAFPVLENGIQTGIHKWFNNNHFVNNGDGQIGRYYFDDEDIAEQWHTYGLLWTETQLRFYVDGILYHTIDITDSNNFGDGNMSCFQDYAHIILNNWIYTAGTANDDDLEYIADPDMFEDGTIDFEIDYVRLYQSASLGSIIYQ